MRKQSGSKEFFTFDTGDIVEAQKRLSHLGDKANLIMSRAVNRSLSNVSKNMKSQVVKRYRIKSERVGRTIKVTRRASASHPTAQIRSVGRHITLTSFQMTPGRRINIKKGGKHGKPDPKVYKAAVKKGQGLQRLSGNPKPFIQRVNNGNVISVRRISPYSRSLEAVYGPAVPQMIKNREIMDIITREAEIMTSKRINHEIDQMMKRRR